MSPLQQKPILHGRDHCPGGADPIPCMISGPSGDYETVVLSTSDLLAYWRLGESAGPWADTSGVGSPADLDEDGSGTALSPNVTGALPAAQDDGALEFNYDGVSLTGGRWARNTGTKAFDFASTTGQMSAAIWVKVKASALSRRGVIFGNTGFSAIGTGYLTGWGLQVIYPSQKIRFSRGQPGADISDPEMYAETAAGIVADTWYFVVGTYDQEQIRLYVNAVLADSTADTFGAWSSDDIYVGLGYTGPGTSTDSAFLYGTADEAAVWTRALGQGEINDLYNAGVEGSGDGQVLLTDGSGGTYWDFPLEVTF